MYSVIFCTRYEIHV